MSNNTANGCFWNFWKIINILDTDIQKNERKKCMQYVAAYSYVYTTFDSTARNWFKRKRSVPQPRPTFVRALAAMSETYVSMVSP